MACYSQCNFYLCPSASPYTVGAFADASFTGPICSDSISVGHVDETAEAYFTDGKLPTKISHWRPDNLSHPFPPSFFKSFSAPPEYAGDLSGVGHEVLDGNQGNYLDGRCVVLPLRSYQVLNEYGGVIENVHPTDDLRDCVSFETTVGGDGAAPATAAPDLYEPPATTAAPYEAPATTAAPYEVPATTATPYEEPATTATPYEEPATTATPYEEPATTAAPYEAPATTAAPYEAPATTAAPYEAPATTAAPYEAPVTTAAPHEAPATTVVADAYSTAPGSSTALPGDSDPAITCKLGCPMPASVKPIYAKCVAALGERPIEDYWIFAAANGETADGKKCGTADADGNQLCTGKMTEVEYCDAGFSCLDSDENYRPQIVKCVAEDGEVCQLSDEQRENIILERVTEGTDFFIACEK